jgi:hypothetical protein
MRKNVTAEKLAASAWAAALAPRHDVDKVPEGWFTGREIAEQIGKSAGTTTGYLRKAIAEGRCEAKNFRVIAGQRGVYPTPHYRLL